MAFFEYCARCGKAFASEYHFKEHMAFHEYVKKRDNDRRIARASKLISEQDDIPSITRAPASMQELLNEGAPKKVEQRLAPTKEEVEKRLVESQAVARRRKKLIAVGIEAATMTKAEVNARWEQAKKDGVVE